MLISIISEPKPLTLINSDLLMVELVIKKSQMMLHNMSNDNLNYHDEHMLDRPNFSQNLLLNVHPDKYAALDDIFIFLFNIQKYSEWN
jgi:hypothetical protein